MAKKHQIWSSNKKTRKKAGRKWRRQAKQMLNQQTPKKQIVIERKEKVIVDNTPIVLSNIVEIIDATLKATR